MIPKTYAYITRHTDAGKQVLVFRHRDYPEAGVQVPGGTVDEGESLELAVLREIEEESGLVGLTILRQLESYKAYSQQFEEWQLRHFFELAAPINCPETWSHTVSDGERDKDLVFVYEWWSLERAKRELAGDKGKAIHCLIP
jgi:ADP-ribose pyrophosphatase YjhB (NUDIX family)